MAAVILSLVGYATAAVLWAVAIWRAPSVLRGGEASRSLTVALAAIALAFTLRIPRVMHLFDVTLGVRDLSVLIKHGATVISACFLFDYVNALHGRRPRMAGPVRARYLPALLATVAMLVIFLVALPRTEASDLFPVEHTVGAGDVAYMAVFYGYLGVSLGLSGHTFWVHRGSGRNRLRPAAFSLTAGCVVGCVYTAYRVVIAFVRQVQHRPPLGDEAVTVGLTSVAVLFIVLGVALPPLQSLQKHLDNRRAGWVIHQLWADLTDLYPGVVLGTRESRVRNLFTVGSRARDVVDVVIEIRDARLVLFEATPAELFATATATARDAGLRGEALDVHAEAVWLHAALHHARVHGDGGGDAAAPTALETREDASRNRTPDEEVDWFLKVARAYSRLGRVYRDARDRGPGSGSGEDGGNAEAVGAVPGG